MPKLKYKPIAFYPDLIKDRDFKKNENYSPYELTAGSSKKVWWKCSKCGYQWSVSVGSRNNGTGCPECAKQKRTMSCYRTIISKKGSFADNFPELLKEWDYDHNNGIDPYSLPPFCTVKVWWVCSKCGHQWPATIANRAKGRGCKECYRKNNPSRQRQYAVNKSGSFCDTHPHLLNDWDYEKNTEKPEDFSAGSRYKAFWRCHNCGHEWQFSIFKRTGGHKCPKCHK